MKANYELRVTNGEWERKRMANCASVIPGAARNLLLIFAFSLFATRYSLFAIPSYELPAAKAGN